MTKVSDILLRKGNSIASVSPETTVMQALKIMADENIGSVMVMENEKMLGIVTERDYSRKVILKGKHSTSTPVSEIMTVDLPKIKPSDSIEHCMELMSGSNVRYLPVFEEEKVIGIISITDVVKQTIFTQQETIDHLKNYISSGS